jgi:8-hydroxy-5-deazaflavin:NADPH oxidoreductase
MRIAVLGTGMVGRTIGTRLAGLGHEVTMGSRSAGNDAAAEWARATGGSAAHGTFADAAGAGEIVFNCTSGLASLDALEAAGAERLAGKVLVDVANALDYSGGMPPKVVLLDDDSLGERIQRAFPDARVVKALNTVNCNVMVDPARVPRSHDVFVAGNDDDAKDQVRELLQAFGWPLASIVDLGDISGARATEAYMRLWLRLMGTLGTADFNIATVV